MIAVFSVPDFDFISSLTQISSGNIGAVNAIDDILIIDRSIIDFFFKLFGSQIGAIKPGTARHDKKQNQDSKKLVRCHELKAPLLKFDLAGPANFRIGKCGRPWFSFLSLKIDIDNPEPGAETFCPFEIIQQRPI